MNIITKLRHKIGKLLWKENEWTQAVDEIEQAVYDLRKGKKSEVVLHWRFKWLWTPPSNKFTVRVTLD